MSENSGKRIAVKLIIVIFFLLCFSSRVSAVIETITFETQPEEIQTNLPHFPIASQEPLADDQLVEINGQSFDPAPGYIFAVYPLEVGENAFTLKIVRKDGTVLTSQKTVKYDPAISTDHLELLYYNLYYKQDYLDPDDIEQHKGSVVIDIDQRAVLGILADRLIYGVNKMTRELVDDEGKFIDPVFHLETGDQLPEYGGEMLLFSPDGRRAYYKKIEAELATMQKTTRILPTEIHFKATIPDNGERIYQWSGYIDLMDNTWHSVKYSVYRNFSFVAVDPAENFVITTSYEWARGRVLFHDPFNGITLYNYNRGGGQSNPQLDYLRNISFSADGKYAYVCAYGNPALWNGGVAAIDLASVQQYILNQTPVNVAFMYKNQQDLILGASRNKSFTVQRGANLISEYKIFGDTLAIEEVRQYSLFSPGVIPPGLIYQKFHVKPSDQAGCEFIRGDANSDGKINISDAIFILSRLFMGERDPEIADALDVDDNGTIDISDAVGLLNYLFSTGTPPAAPFPGSGYDRTEDVLAACADR